MSVAFIASRGHVSGGMSQERYEKMLFCQDYLSYYDQIKRPTQEQVHTYMSCGGKIHSPSVGEIFGFAGLGLFGCLIVAFVIDKFTK